eukprot:752376-Hanusia_phi.AAC.2
MLRLLRFALLMAVQGLVMGYDIRGFRLCTMLGTKIAGNMETAFVVPSAFCKFSLKAGRGGLVSSWRSKVSFHISGQRRRCHATMMNTNGDPSAGAQNELDNEEGSLSLDKDLERIRTAMDPTSEFGRRLKEATDKLDKLSQTDNQPKSTKLFKSVKKRTGAFAVMVETCLEEGDEQEVSDLSRQIRQSKSSGIMVDVRNSFSSLGRQSFEQLMAEQIAKEQKSSKGNFPGPCPIVVRHRSIVHPWQACR